MKEAGLADITQVRITGGGAKSPVWRQILADVLNSKLITVNTVEGAAYGAAVLAATGAGAFPDVPSACAALIRATGSTTPGPASADHEMRYPLYRALYPAVSPTFKAVAQIANQPSHRSSIRPLDCGYSFSSRATHSM